jgi:hypothetical protein
MAQQGSGIRREVLETALFIGLFGVGAGQVVTGKDRADEARELRGEVRRASRDSRKIIERLDDHDGFLRVYGIRWKEQDSQLGELEMRLERLEKRGR